MKSYPSFTLEFVRKRLPMDQGWAFYSWAMENDPWMQLSGLKRQSRGYLGQEIDALVAEAKEHFGMK